MCNITFVNDGISYRRITKASAKKAFLAGKEIFACPCNFRPFSMWYTAYSMMRNGRFAGNDEGAIDFFTRQVNALEHYSCSCSETGRYAAFYVAA